MNIENAEQLAGVLDSTLLDALATEEEIKKLCSDAKEYEFASVCIMPRWVSLAADILHNTGVAVCSVVSFPHGADTTRQKAAAVKQIIFDGADEIDMVADLAAVVENNPKYMLAQLNAVLKVCRAMKPNVVFKLIIEAAALTMDQKMFACAAAKQAGVDFIKTSTGTHKAGGATVEDVGLMKQIAPSCKVKAAGGIRNAGDAIRMLEAGADRIGTSSAVKIVEEYKVEQG
jgi:deoxyribose-phosphate aldolase